jgi:hypothetical protein
LELTWTSTGHSASPMTFCATPPIQARPRLCGPWRASTMRSAPQHRLRGGQQFLVHAAHAHFTLRRQTRLAGLQQRCGQRLLGSGRASSLAATHTTCSGSRGRPPSPLAWASRRRRHLRVHADQHGAAPQLRAARGQQHAAGAWASTLPTISPTSRLASKLRWPRRRSTIRSAGRSRAACTISAKGSGRGARAVAASRRRRGQACRAAGCVRPARRHARPAAARPSRIRGCSAPAARRAKAARARQRQRHGLGAAVELGVLAGQQHALEVIGHLSAPRSAGPKRPGPPRPPRPGRWHIGLVAARGVDRHQGQQAGHRAAGEQAMPSSPACRHGPAGQPAPAGGHAGARRGTAPPAATTARAGDPPAHAPGSRPLT